MALSLEKYLQALKDCPDERLTDEYGLYDNFSINLGCNFGDFLVLLEKQKNFEFEHDVEGYDTKIFKYVSGIVNLQVSPIKQEKIPFGDNELEKAYFTKLREFQTSVMLHMYRMNEPIDGITPLRAIEKTNNEICNLAIDNKISLMLPKSIGWNKADEVGFRNLDFIIQYEP